MLLEINDGTSANYQLQYLLCNGCSISFIDIGHCMVNKSEHSITIIYSSILKEFHPHWKFDVCPELPLGYNYVRAGSGITADYTGPACPGCPVQIRAHHHKDVYVDMNKVDDKRRTIM